MDQYRKWTCNLFKLTCYTPVTTSSRWIHSRTQHVRHHSMRSILSPHDQQCIQIAVNARATGQIRCKNDTCCSIRSAAHSRLAQWTYLDCSQISNVWKPISSGQGWPLLQSNMSSANFEDKKSTCPIKCTQPLDHTIRETRRLISRQWPTINAKRSPKPFVTYLGWSPSQTQGITPRQVGRPNDTAER